MIWIYYYILKVIRLDLDNSCWIRKIPNLTTLTFGFPHTKHGFSRTKHNLAWGDRTS